MRRYLSLLAVSLPLAVGACSSTTSPDDGDTPGDSPPVIEYFITTHPDVQHGDWTQLRWKGDRATHATISPSIGFPDTPNQGAVSVRPHEPTTYTLALINDFGADSASVTVDVDYYVGMYVDATNGDDARTGEAPGLAVKTLGEAIARSGGGGTIYISGGVYPDNLVVSPTPLQIYGGLDPITFFENPDQESIIQPASGLPLVVDGVVGPVVMSNLTFVAPADAGATAEIRNVTDPIGGFDGCILRTCRFLGTGSSEGVGLRIGSGAVARVEKSQIRGGRGGLFSETAGLVIEDDAKVIVNNCFVDGGQATLVSSGVLVDGTGDIRLGLNTVSAEVTTHSGTGVNSAAIRIRSGSPAIGGNILFTQGAGSRFGVIEECVDCDPNWLYGNLFIALGVVPYDDFPSSDDPMTEQDLNTDQMTTQVVGSAWENILYTGAVATNVFVDPPAGDFHLEPTLLGGQPNPAIDALSQGTAIGSENHGLVREDIDGDARPGTGSQYDLGADEL